MQIYKPIYYDHFHCLAGACPDTCCKGWDIQVDPDTARRYRALPGPLGDQLRQALVEADGETILSQTDGHCLLWRSDGLCAVQCALGEEALCQVCRDFPRLTHDYGDFRELGLELSCPEGARLILTAPPAPFLCQSVPDGEPGDYDGEAMDILKATRKTMLSILSETSRPPEEVLAIAYLYGSQAQAWLDGGEETSFSPEASLETARELAKPGNAAPLLDFFQNLEILTPQWRSLLSAPVSGQWEPGHLALARYFVERYWLQAVADYDLWSRVKFMIVSCLVVKHLPGPLVETARLYSKEIENDADNVDAILDAAYTHPAFRDDYLLGLLLFSEALA